MELQEPQTGKHCILPQARTQGSVEVILTESLWKLCRNESDEWFPAVKLLLAISDDGGREVERIILAASDTCECADPGSGWPQL